jgi:two-component system response regulator LytT
MNVLIVEDESHTAALLQEMIEQDGDFMVTEKLESVLDAVEYLHKYQQNLDLLFFDIQLADGKSFEIFKHVDVVVPVVFCTAYDEYTLQAIKNNGIDYVLKPFKEEEIQDALQKYKRLITNIQAKNPSPIHFQMEAPKQYQQSFLTQYRKKSVVKGVEEIALFFVENENVYLLSFSGEKLPLFKKLEYIESVCDPSQFFRINRQMLVNRKAIISFEPYFNRKVILQLKVQLADKPVVSRLKVTPFQKWLENH